MSERKEKGKFWIMPGWPRPPLRRDRQIADEKDSLPSDILWDTMWPEDQRALTERARTTADRMERDWGGAKHRVDMAGKRTDERRAWEKIERVKEGMYRIFDALVVDFEELES